MIGQLYKDESQHIRKLFDSIIRSVWYFSEETVHHIRHQTSDPDCPSLGGEVLLFLTAQGGSWLGIMMQKSRANLARIVACNEWICSGKTQRLSLKGEGNLCIWIVWAQVVVSC